MKSLKAGVPTTQAKGLDSRLDRRPRAPCRIACLPNNTIAEPIHLFQRTSMLSTLATLSFFFFFVSGSQRGSPVETRATLSLRATITSTSLVMPVSNIVLPAILLAGWARAVDLPACTLSFDGRVPQNATAQTFVSAQSPFNPGYVLGPNVTWDQVIEFPQIPPSRVSGSGGPADRGPNEANRSV